MEEKFEFYNEKMFEIRKSKGLSQEELGEKIGVSRQSIYAWESGKSVPDIENLYKICQIFDIKTNELTNLCQEQEKSKENKKFNLRKIKKISIIVIVIFIVIYLLIAMRQFFALVKLNKKIHSIGDYDNYSYNISYIEMRDGDNIKSTSSDDIYYKNNILKIVHFSASEERNNWQEVKWTQWTDISKKESYIFEEIDNKKTVRKVPTVDFIEEPYKISTITDNGLVSENNGYNFLASMCWIFKYFSFKVEGSGNYYFIKSSTKNERMKIDTDFEECINKFNGYPVEKNEYRKDGTILIQKYKDIKVNETTDEDIKMPDLNEYQMVD